jgi:hypothetical protein
MMQQLEDAIVEVPTAICGTAFKGVPYFPVGRRAAEGK